MEPVELSFDEIPDGQKFESLIVSYFEGLQPKGDSEPSLGNIVSVEVKPSGIGTDGGRDILVSVAVRDGLSTFKRRWVIQCKFHASSISPRKISDINIPTLLYSYDACGYLLVCKQEPTSKLTELFERLEQNCRLKNKYMIWSGEQFKRLLISKEDILRQFFPKYFKYCVKMGIIKR